ncbi:MAG: RtcB family protein [Elusimicrobiota bacterium]
MNLEKIDENCFVIKKGYKEGMNSDAIIYANENLIKNIEQDAINQLINITTLPGIAGPAIAMPDIHKGYGFPIGGVAAFNIEKGIISPGGIGYDINCGVRLVKTDLKKKDIEGKIKEIAYSIFRDTPVGVGSEGKIYLSDKEYEKVFKKGAKWAIENGYGSSDDIEFIESKGAIETETYSVTQKAKERGRRQLGTLGSGNHFIEVQFVDEVYDEKAAYAFGIEKDTITIMIHTGSRGFGHQICSDYINIMLKALQKYGISLHDKELACAPFDSKEGRDYFNAMNAASNFAWANRQILKHFIETAFIKALKISPNMLSAKTLYDVAHNIAKVENHTVDGKNVKVIVHRKGATRSFPAFNPELPKGYMEIGQPVIIPGDMGRYSYLLYGLDGAMKKTFGTSCHGAGRLMSRAKSVEIAKRRNIKSELEKNGILVLADLIRTINEEMPDAYKDVKDVVEVVSNSGIAAKVARLKPLCVIKG